MRGIALLLLLANACVGVYGYMGTLDAKPDPMHVPFKPERLKLLTPQQVAALGPAKVAQLNLTCAEWGPMSEAEKLVAMETLNPLQLGKTLSQQPVEIANPFMVTVTAAPGKGGLDETLRQLEGLGLSGVEKLRVDEGNLVSVGVFRTEAAARAQIRFLEAHGVKSAQIRPRDAPMPGTLLIIREPQQSTVAALEAARNKLADVSLQFVSCRDRGTG